MSKSFVPTQVYLEPHQHSELKRRARASGISMASYLRQLVSREFEPARVEVKLTDLAGAVDTGPATDIANDRTSLLREAVQRRHGLR